MQLQIVALWLVLFSYQKNAKLFALGAFFKMCRRGWSMHQEI
jgi:hypothetical protein